MVDRRFCPYRYEHWARSNTGEYASGHKYALPDSYKDSDPDSYAASG